MKKNITLKPKKALSVILAGILAVSSATAMGIPAKAEESKTEYRLADSIQDGTILHCFNWRYSDITDMIPNIASAGFTSIQISPAQVGLQDRTGAIEYKDSDGEEVEYRLGGTVWYDAYCPTELAFCDDGDFNHREDLIELCDEAEKYGINIIMDVIANHMSRGYHEFLNDELSKAEYWHDNNNKQISNYSDRTNITNRNLGQLPDLNTESEYIQKLTLDYINDLKSMGVDGIRWDAAKHIALPSEGSEFWKVVTDTGIYNYGEILTGPTDDTEHDELMAEYAEYMSVTDSSYSQVLFNSFNQKRAPKSLGNWTKRGVTADKLVYWGESHDTYSNDGQYGGTNFMSQNIIDRAYAVAAARADAASLYLSRPSSAVKDEIYFGKRGSIHFMSPEVSAINHFHNAMIGKKDCYELSENCAVITRENGGAVIVCGDEPGEVTVSNAGGYAVPGTYIDEVSGNTFVITEDAITGAVGESGIAVLYDSPVMGRLYIESDSLSNTFYSEMSVTLRYTLAENASYTLTQTKYGEIISTETKEFSDGDVITFGKDAPVNSVFTLDLKATSVDGREMTESFNYYVGRDPDTEPPLESYQLHSITFDNLNICWSEVYVYITCKDGDKEINNADYPGEKMTGYNSEYYTYVIPEKFKDYRYNSLNVTFSDGKDNKIFTYSSWYPEDDTPIPITMYYDSHGNMDKDGDWRSYYHGRPLPNNYTEPNRITFDNAMIQWDEVYITISEEPIETNDSPDLPAEKMTAQDDDYYTYVIPEEFKGKLDLYVTFSDGKGNIITGTPSWYEGEEDEKMIIPYGAFGMYVSTPMYSYWATNFLGICGDFNEDGKISSKDALMILRTTIGYFERGNYALADVNQDQKITAKDSLLILRYTINLPSNEYVGNPQFSGD